MLLHRFTLLFIFLVVTNTALAQNITHSPVKALSNRITHGIVDAKARLDAIFYWITDNIAYDVDLYQKYLSGGDMYEDYELKYRDSLDYNEAVANIVLARKKGVCDGYARLFKSLCNHARIQCEVVAGRTRNFLRPALTEHAWNAVRIYGKWHLVDPTWASGYVGETFTKRLDTYYYLTPPEKMFLDHLPDEQKWTLLDESYDSAMFNRSPVTDVNAIKNGLIEYFPRTRNIKLKKGEPITVWLLFDRSPADFTIEISATGRPESRATRLNVDLTEKVYDSLFNVDPDYFREIEKIEIVSKKITGNKCEFVIKPVYDIDGIHIYVDYGIPALTYITINHAEKR